MLAAFSLLALLAPGSGAITREWAAFLRRLLGWSAYLFPFALAGLLYLGPVRGVALPPGRAFGATLLLVNALAITHLLRRLPDPFELSVAGYGGGWVGWVLSSALNGALGRLGAYLFCVALALIGAMLTFELSPSQAWEAWLSSVRRVLEARRAQAAPVRPARRSSRPRPLPLELEEPEESEDLAAPEPERIVVPPADAVPTSAPAVRIINPEPTPPPPEDMELPALAPESDWTLPDPTAIFAPDEEVELTDDLVEERAATIEQTLASLGVPAQVVEAQRGPAITQFAVKPGFIEKRSADGKVLRMRVRVNKISALADDLALALAASPVRIQAPIPGRGVVGVEVPNPQTQVVSLGGVFLSPEFRKLTSPLALALGRDISGRPVVADLARMPHLLMAGATGSGKSVAINSIICCLLARNTPDTLRLVMIDPKRVELATYRGVPHLVGTVVSDAEEAVGALKWAGREMDRRYTAFAEVGARDLRGYNSRMEKEGNRPLPYIVVVVDELADLMMSAPLDVERALVRLAQMSRATGIHLVVATQRPSVDVVTGLIKANFPARIAFAVSSQVDSRVILDTPGADRLLGRGDMLYMSPGGNRLIRAQGCWVSDSEIAELVRFWKKASVDAPEYDHLVQMQLWSSDGAAAEDEGDDLLEQAIEVITQEGRASTTMLQRHLKIGYNRASRMIDALIERGLISREVDGPYNSHSLLVSPDAEAEEEEPDELDEQ
jgi:S-DNA-T family DNA segregation ATPase FtsK/SpoIIIE